MKTSSCHTPNNEEHDEQLQASKENNLTWGGATELAYQQMSDGEVSHTQK